MSVAVRSKFGGGMVCYRLLISLSITVGIVSSDAPRTHVEGRYVNDQPGQFKSLSEKKCFEYKDYATGIKSEGGSFEYEEEEKPDDEEENFHSCTMGWSPLILNGTPAGPREFPHQVLIGYLYSPRVKKWECGGSLISENFVLSAAHCSRTSYGKPRFALIGDLNIESEKDSADPEERRIIEIFDHPCYHHRSGSQNDDITLYKLDQNVVLNGYKRPACLQTIHNIGTEKAIASGWGDTSYKNSKGGRTPHLQKVELDIIPENKCSEFWDPSLVSHEHSICAGDLIGNKDTCQGDSGGPLQIKNKDHYCMYSIIGITARGFKCGERVPAVYTRVSKYLQWIEDVVWGNNSMAVNCN